MRKLSALFLLLLAMPMAQGAAAFGTEVQRYKNQGGSAISSDVITLTTGVPVGKRLCAIIGREGTKTLSSVGDSKGNGTGSLWTIHGSRIISSVHQGDFASVYVGTALVAGDTITLTYSGSEDMAREVILFTFDGVAATGQPDVTVISPTMGTFNTTVVTTITPGVAGAAVAGFVIVQGDHSYSGWSGTTLGAGQVLFGDSGSTVGLRLTPFYTIQTAATAFSPAGTIAAIDSYICILVSFKPATTRNFYISTSGTDGNAGTSTAAPFRHNPGDTNATSVAAGITPGPGDTFFYKGGDVFSFDTAIKQAGNATTAIIYDGTGHDATGATWGTGRAEIDLAYTYYHAFYSNPGKDYITLRGFKIYHAKNNNNAVNVLNNRAESDQLITYTGDGDIYSEAGIFDFGGSYWYMDQLDLSDFENAYDRSVLGAESDSDTPNVTPIEIPCTKAGIELYNGAHSCTITNCTLWAIGRTAIKIFGCTNFLVTDCNIGGSDAITNKGWFAVAVKVAGNGGWFGNGTLRRIRAHDGWQYQGDEAQQRCHAGDWFHIFGDPNFDHAGVAAPTANDVKGILFDTIYCYSNKKFSYYNGTAYYFLESGCFDIEWRNCLSINSFSGDIEARDSSNLTVTAHTSISEGTQPLLWKAKSTKGFPLKSIYVTNSVFMTQSANSANVAMGTSGAGYDGELPHTDYNSYFTTAHNNRIELHGTNYTSITTWRTQTGQDAHSLFVDPKLVTVPTGSGWDTATSGDFHPDSSQSSPLIAAGLDQSARFTIFYDGTTRTAPWTIGALPSAAGGGGGGGGGPTYTLRPGRALRTRRL